MLWQLYKRRLPKQTENKRQHEKRNERNWVRERKREREGKLEAAESSLSWRRKLTTWLRSPLWKCYTQLLFSISVICQRPTGRMRNS